MSDHPSYIPHLLCETQLEPDGLYALDEETVVVSFYHLHNNRKTGALGCFHVDRAHRTAQEVSMCRTPAVHNLVPVVVQQRTLLAACTASAKVLFFSPEPALPEVDAAVVPEVCEVLSVSVGESILVASRNDGAVSLWRPFRDGRWKPLKEFHCHDAEVWCVACRPGTNMFLTGSDDTKAVLWDDETPVTTFRFDAGVTDAVWEDADHVILGSYDGSVRAVDLRNPRQPLWEGRVDGGAGWRLIPNGDRIVVAGACGGVAEFGRNGGKWFQATGPHESMVYGADALGSDIIACSFYDKKLVLWEHTADSTD